MVSRRAVRSLPLGPRVLDPLVLGVDLLLPSHLQCAAEELVVDHISWLNPGLGYPVESLGAELATGFGADSHSPCVVLVEHDVLAHRGAGALGLLEHVERALVVDRQLSRDLPPGLELEDVRQWRGEQERAVSVEVALRSAGKASVEVISEVSIEEVVRRYDVADALESQLLHESVLQRPVGALDAALGGCGVGAPATRELVPPPGNPIRVCA